MTRIRGQLGTEQTVDARSILTARLAPFTLAVATLTERVTIGHTTARRTNTAATLTLATDYRRIPTARTHASAVDTLLARATTGAAAPTTLRVGAGVPAGQAPRTAGLTGQADLFATQTKLTHALAIAAVLLPPARAITATTVRAVARGIDTGRSAANELATAGVGHPATFAHAFDADLANATGDVAAAAMPLERGITDDLPLLVHLVANALTGILQAHTQRAVATRKALGAADPPTGLHDDIVRLHGVDIQHRDIVVDTHPGHTIDSAARAISHFLALVHLHQTSVVKLTTKTQQHHRRGQTKPKSPQKTHPTHPSQHGRALMVKHPPCVGVGAV